MSVFLKLVGFGGLVCVGLLVSAGLAFSGHAAFAGLALVGTCAAAVVGIVLVARDTGRPGRAPR